MNRYLILLATLLLVFTSCEKQEGEYFDPSVNGIYFKSKGTGDNLMLESRNFADYILADSSKLVVQLKVVMLGYAVDHDRKAIVKSKVFKNLPMADIEFPSEIVLPAGQSSLILRVTLNRPQEMQTKYGAVLYLDTQDNASDFAQGIDSLDQFKIVAEETYQKSALWEVSAKTYFGEWDVQKHIFLVKTTKSPVFGDESSKYKEYNRKAVDSLRRYYASAPANPISIAIPFYSPDTPSDEKGEGYPKPIYWTSIHDKYLGFNFNPMAWPYLSNFAFSFMSKAYGITTATEAEYYQATEVNMKKVNKEAVELMMSTYNKFYNLGNEPFESWEGHPLYKEYFYANIMPGIDYELVKPAQWDGDSAPKVDAYYGAYSDAKYRFMLKVVAENTNANMVKCRGYLPYLFPLVKIGDEVEYAEFKLDYWDQQYGWKIMKDLNPIFKQALAASGETGFTFPDPPADPVN